jgi:hypothetical protein
MRTIDLPPLYGEGQTAKPSGWGAYAQSPHPARRATLPIKGRDKRA